MQRVAESSQENKTFNAHLYAKKLTGVLLLEADVKRVQIVGRPVAAGLGGTSESGHGDGGGLE